MGISRISTMNNLGFTAFIRPYVQQVDKVTNPGSSMSLIIRCHINLQGFTIAPDPSQPISRCLVNPNRTGYTHSKSDNIERKFNRINKLGVSGWTYPQCAKHLHCCCYLK
jgi:hypothetical protein